MFCLDEKLREENLNLLKVQNVFKKLFWKIARKMTEGIYAGQIEELKENTRSSENKNRIIPV
jgi:hypothetical protein